MIFKTSEEISKRSRRLWEIRNKINPAFAPQGSNLSYDDYNKAGQEAKYFENKLWLSKEEHDRLMLQQHMELSARFSEGANKEYIKKVEEIFNKVRFSMWRAEATASKPHNQNLHEILDLINKILEKK